MIPKQDMLPKLQSDLNSMIGKKVAGCRWCVRKQASLQSEFRSEPTASGLWMEWFRPCVTKSSLSTSVFLSIPIVYLGKFKARTNNSQHRCEEECNEALDLRSLSHTRHTKSALVEELSTTVSLTCVLISQVCSAPLTGRLSLTCAQHAP